MDWFDIYRATQSQKEAIICLCERDPSLTPERILKHADELMDLTGVETTDLVPWIALAIRNFSKGKTSC
jgi:hypothetical protein